MIRPYQSSDFERLILLYKNKAAYGGNYDPERDEAGKLFKTAEAGNLIVSEINGRVVGSVMILDNPHTFWLLRFVVDPESKVRKIAAEELDEAARATAAERGHESIIVYTNPHDQALLDRYRSLGYIESVDYKCFWKEVEA